MRYDYHTDPARGPLIITVALLIGMVLVPTILLRLVVLAMASGPGIWLLIQWRRRGHGVQVGADHVLIQGPLTGRAQCIPYTMVRGYITTPSGRLLLACRQPEPAQVPTVTGSPALTDLRPELHRRPRYKLVATPPLDDAEALRTALDAAAIPVPDDRTFSPDQLRLWARSRRIRNLIVAFLLVMGTPFYMIILGRTVAGLFSVLGGGSFGR